MNESDQLFLDLLTHDMLFSLQVIMKIASGLFFSPDAIAIYTVFGLGFLIFWIKSKIETH